jgi:hypothetical protein
LLCEVNNHLFISDCGIIFLVSVVLNVLLEKAFLIMANEAKKQNSRPDQSNSGNDDYRRDGAHLGNTSSTGSTQKGGGGSGYDVNREQEQINREQEEMHKERDQDQLEVEKTQTPPQPEINPGREDPDQRPNPETRPGSSTMGSYNRNANGGWSQSSWDPNSIR